MLRFVFKRLLLMVLVLLGVLLFVFTVSRLSGDPIPSLLGDSYTQEEYNDMRAKLGLDAPLPVQFFNSVRRMVTEFDLGTSYTFKNAVKDEVTVRLPLSLSLAMIAMLWSLPFGMLCGIISAIRQYKPEDYTLTTLAMICASMPSFWVGLMLMLLFSLTLKLVPATGLDSWRSYILPCVALGLHPVANFCRMTRSTMLEVIRQDYIRTARSKGLSETRVIVNHALQNSAIPIITLLGTQIGIAIGNAAVVESVFNIPGLGSYMIYGITMGDYPIVQGSVLVFSVVVCCLNLVVDILYGFIDPRIKARYVSSGAKLRLFNKNTAIAPTK